jgi:hypothetical protein
MSDDLRRNALKVIREGRLCVLYADVHKGTFSATVRSSKPGTRMHYLVDVFNGRSERPIWICSCGPGGVCAHVAAAQLIAPVEVAS